ALTRVEGSAQGGPPTVYHVYKPTTSIGRGEENDITLPDPAVRDAHAQIRFDGRDFNIAIVDPDAEVAVGGKRRARHRLADQGVLILLQGSDPGVMGVMDVKVARNVQRESIGDARGQLSDSIVDKVVKTKRAVIVSDALHDAEFSGAMSVMNLKLSSVMCVP